MRRNLPFLLFASVILTVLIALGTWQVRRLAEKTAYLTALEARIGATPVAIPAAPDPVHDRFLAVQADGALEGPEIHVLVSTRDFGAGFRIIQAFDTGSRRILLDRGFVRASQKQAPHGAGRVEIVGNLYWPDEIDRFTPETDLDANIWYARDVPAMARALDTEPVMIVAGKKSQTDPSVTPLPVDTSSIPNRHLEYVLTWYGLAATWVVMTVYFLRRRRGQDEGKS